jgi:sugar/nucleoside kinase (ribokinase family)
MENSIGVVGSFALDTIDGLEDSPTPPWPGGSALYFTLAAKEFIKVKVCGIISKQDFATFIELITTPNVDTSLIKQSELHTYSWHARYDPLTGQNVQIGSIEEIYSDFEPEIPDNIDVLFLGTVPDNIQRKALSKVDKNMPIGLDVMTPYLEKGIKAIEDIISAATWFFLNVQELKALGLYSPREILKRFPAEGVVLKMGAEGATWYEPNLETHVPAYPVEKVRDQTGAGDCFAAGFIYEVVYRSGNPRYGLARGHTLASIAIEGFGVERIKIIDKEELAKREGYFRERGYLV